MRFNFGDKFEWMLIIIVCTIQLIFTTLRKLHKLPPSTRLQVHLLQQATHREHKLHMIEEINIGRI